MKLFEAVSVLSYGISALIPKKKNRWVFGAWFGTAVSDNTKALYDYVAAEHPEIERIWVAREPEKVKLPGCIVIKRNSLKSLPYLLTARVAVMNQGFGDLAAVNLLGGVFRTQLWHGVAWKKIGRDAYPALKGLEARGFSLENTYDLYIAPSRRYAESVKSAFGAKEEEILLCGQPRNEGLFSPAFLAESRRGVEEALGVRGKRLIVYMPTFRDKTAEVFSFHTLEGDPRFQALAKKYNFVVVEKLHFKSGQQQEGETGERLVYGLPGADAAQLLGAADLLVTDYSSCFFDYLITDRPIIHYAYDYDYYKNKDRGLYYDIDEVAAGTVAGDTAELLKALEANLAGDPCRERRAEIRERFITFESADNSRRIFEAIEKRLGR